MGSLLIGTETVCTRLPSGTRPAGQDTRAQCPIPTGVRIRHPCAHGDQQVSSSRRKYRERRKKDRIYRARRLGQYRLKIRRDQQSLLHRHLCRGVRHGRCGRRIRLPKARLHAGQGKMKAPLSLRARRSKKGCHPRKTSHPTAVRTGDRTLSRTAVRRSIRPIPGSLGDSLGWSEQSLYEAIRATAWQALRS